MPLLVVCSIALTCTNHYMNQTNSMKHQHSHLFKQKQTLHQFKKTTTTAKTVYRTSSRSIEHTPRWTTRMPKTQSPLSPLNNVNSKKNHPSHPIHPKTLTPDGLFPCNHARHPRINTSLNPSKNSHLRTTTLQCQCRYSATRPAKKGLKTPVWRLLSAPLPWATSLKQPWAPRAWTSCYSRRLIQTRP